MEIAGEYTFEAPQDEVWEALRDPDVLGQVMPGAQGFEEVGENEYTGMLKIRVGPVQGNFQGNIQLHDIEEPESYRIKVDGRGAPGFVNAEGGLKLTGQGQQTHMSYEGEAQVGGRIASVGQRLLDSSARSIIRQSLDSLNEYLKAQAATSAAAEHDDQPDDATGGPTNGEGPAGSEAKKRPAPAYTPPSEMEVALNVARDVARDYLPEEPDRALIAVIFFVVGFVAGLLVNRK